MTHLSIVTTPAVELVRALREGTVRAVDLFDEAEERHRRFGDVLNAYKMLMNLWDFPSITLPVGKDPDGLPIGLQLSSRSGSDDALLGIARAVERALGTAREILGAAPLCP